MNSRQSTPPNRTQTWPPHQWRGLIWYLILMLVLLWTWQEAGKQVAYTTIPYSQFKEYVRQREVISCSMGDSEIQGTIQPRAAAPAKAEQPSSQAAQTQTKNQEKSSAAPENKLPAAPAPQSGNKEAQSQPATPKSFAFRTVRVDDPNLVSDLEKAGVKFSGERPSVISQALWFWILPIGLMVLLWIYLSRRMGGLGQSVMRFGSSGAKLVADTGHQSHIRRCGRL